MRERVLQFQLVKETGPAGFAHLRARQPETRHARIQMDGRRTIRTRRPPVPNLFDGVKNGYQTGIDDADGVTLAHALEYEYSRARQHAAQLDALPRRGHKEIAAPLNPQTARHRPDAQTVSVGLDHCAASRLRRRFAQGPVVPCQRIQIDRQDARRRKFGVGGHEN